MDRIGDLTLFLRVLDLGSISAAARSLDVSVAVASQLILIKSRAMLPRAPESATAELEDDAGGPEAELRARLLLYRAFRDAGAALQAGAIQRHGLFRREPSAALAAGLAGAAVEAVSTHGLDNLTVQLAGAAAASLLG